MKPYQLIFLAASLIYADCKSQSRTLEQTQMARLKYPPTKTVNQIDTYHGVKVADPYRWLENDSAAEVKAWVQTQNKVTNDYLTKIPFREEIRRRIKDVIQYSLYSIPEKTSDYFFFSKGDGIQNQPVIYRQKGLTGEPEVFLDPNPLSKDGTTRVSVGSISHDNRYIVLTTQASGSDWAEFTIREVATGKQLPDKIEWAKSGTSWQGSGFYYSRYDEPSKGKEFSNINEFHKVYYHRLGTAQTQDHLVFIDKHPQTLSYSGTTEDERFLILYLLLGKDKTEEIRCRNLSKKDAPLQSVLKGNVGEFDVIDNVGDKLLVRTFYRAPNFRLVLIDPQHPEEANWLTVIPEKTEPLESVSVAGGKIFARYLKDVTSRVYQHDLSGKLEHEIKLPGLGVAEGFWGKKGDKETFYQFVSPVYPRTIFKYNIADGTSEVFRKPEVKFNLENYETKQVFYTSKDGTKVPMFLTYRKGLKQDGANPVQLYAYGGYNVNVMPNFSAIDCVLMDVGVVVAVANIRGGGEYGEKWHQGGMLLNTQNRFDDFIAAAEYLIREKYTAKDKIAILGGSHGGCLVGSVMLQRPDLFKVALPAVGTLDMLRFQHFTIGHNWKREYGDSDSLVHFKNLYAYSPVHNVKKGVSYPATLATTADHDDRVVPMHSYKFISALQAKQSGPNPVLIRIETNSGHGSSSLTKWIENRTDEISFMLYNIGVKVAPVRLEEDNYSPRSLPNKN